MRNKITNLLDNGSLDQRSVLLAKFTEFLSDAFLLGTEFGVEICDEGDG